MNKKNLALILLVSFIALLARFIPHWPNFSPLASVMLFAGFYSKQKKYMLLPLLALFISDIFIGFYKWEIMLTVYTALLAAGLIGRLLKKDLNFINITSASLASALLFFISTNFAVWYFGDWYTKDLSGLLLNYSLAIPFFKSTLLSNLLYTGFMFSLYEIIKTPVLKTARQK